MLNNTIMTTKQEYFYLLQRSSAPRRYGQVENTIRLMDGGATIPFISRYALKRWPASLMKSSLCISKKSMIGCKELDARKEDVIKSTVRNRKRWLLSFGKKLMLQVTMSELWGYLPAIQAQATHTCNNCQGKRTRTSCSSHSLRTRLIRPWKLKVFWMTCCNCLRMLFQAPLILWQNG